MKKVLLGVLLVALFAAVWYSATSLHRMKVNARASKFNLDIDNLFTGLQTYKEHVGTYPVGSNAEVVKALKGKNPKNVIILVGQKTELNDKGELVDPWGTALRLYFSDSSVLVRSAGPNKRFDDSSNLGSDDLFRSN